MKFTLEFEDTPLSYGCSCSFGGLKLFLIPVLLHLLFTTKDLKFRLVCFILIFLVNFFLLRHNVQIENVHVRNVCLCLLLNWGFFCLTCYKLRASSHSGNCVLYLGLFELWSVSLTRGDCRPLPGSPSWAATRIPPLVER